MRVSHDFFPSQFVRGERLGWLRSLSFSADGKPPVVGNLPLVAALNPACRLRCSQEGQGDRTMSTHWGRFGAGHCSSWFKSVADSSGELDDQLVQALLLVTIQKDQQKQKGTVKGSFRCWAPPPPSLHSIGPVRFASAAASFLAL